MKRDKNGNNLQWHSRIKYDLYPNWSASLFNSEVQTGLIQAADVFLLTFIVSILNIFKLVLEFKNDEFLLPPSPLKNLEPWFLLECQKVWLVWALFSSGNNKLLLNGGCSF